MDAKNPIFVLTCLFVALPIALTACPSKEDIAPCTCTESFGSADIGCSKLDDGDLANVARRLRGMTISTFTIEDSKFGYIPHDIFKGVKIWLLSIISSTMKALTDRGDAFVGLEDHLEYLDISNCVSENEWDWSVLRNLKKLMELSMHNSFHLESIGEDLKKISVSSVESLSIFGNNISFVSDHAFDSFENIEFLSLRYNKITNVKRTMLPNPALKLQHFYINGNLIEEIPRDMFTNMPNLRNLYIGYNNILVLNQKTLSPVWEYLETFDASGNDLRCDCGMSWIPEGRIPPEFLGACDSPPELKGKKLTKLTSKDFVKQCRGLLLKHINEK